MNMVFKTLVAAIAAIALIACEDKPETAGEKVDKVIEETKDVVEDTKEKVSDVADEVEDELDDACEKIKEEVDAKDKDC